MPAQARPRTIEPAPAFETSDVGGITSGRKRVRRHAWADLSDFEIDAASPEAKSTQVYKIVQRAILSGAAPSGSRLPSTRGFATRLGISRTTVVSAFMQLLDEGYITGRKGSGSYVAAGLPTDLAGVPQPTSRTAANALPVLSAAGQRYAALPAETFSTPAMPFNNAVVAVDARTSDLWRTLVTKRLRVLGDAHLGYGHPGGTPEMRAIISTYLRAARGVRCEPGQVILLSGGQQAIDLVIKTLLDPGAEVWVEDPGYPATTAALVAAGVDVRPVPVDAEGLDVGEGMRRHPGARAAFVTPSHQFPLGCAMSMQRRLELLAWARDARAWVVEDDFDSEFRYSGKPLASLQGLDEAGCVIYVGTFSKVLFPGLRLGYAVVPPALVHVFQAARFLTDRFAPTILQAALCEFMEQGYFTAHIRRMRAHYEAMRDMLVRLLEQRLATHVEVDPPAQGLHLIARLKGGLGDQAVARAAMTAQVQVRPISTMYIQAPPVQALMMGYAGFNPHQMRSAVNRLTRVLDLPG